MGIPILVVVSVAQHTATSDATYRVFGHRGASLQRLVSHMFYTTEGIFGIPLGVSSVPPYFFLYYLEPFLKDRHRTVLH